MSKRLCAILILAVAASGCSRVTNNQGYVADEELVSAVQPGVDNKESVQRALGRPTLTGEWNENVWYLSIIHI